MITCDDVKLKIAKELSGAKISVTNPRGDDVHFAVEVEWSGFEGLSKIKQHQKIYACFNNHLNECGMSLHALQIKTSIPQK